MVSRGARVLQRIVVRRLPRLPCLPALLRLLAAATTAAAAAAATAAAEPVQADRARVQVAHLVRGRARVRVWVVGLGFVLLSAY